MKIVITGPESSGKTTLAAALAEYFQIDFIEEYAREYLLPKNGHYNFQDLLKIAKGQHESAMSSKHNGLIIMDTDLLTVKIWSEYKFEKCDNWIKETLKKNKPSLYLLCVPDIPWESDLLRENPNDRDELFEIFQSEIIKLEVPYIELGGTAAERKSLAIQAIEEL